MQVTWILEPDTLYSYHDKLASEVIEQGHSVVTIPRYFSSLQLGDTSRYYDELAPMDSCVICHASFDFTELVADDELWNPGVYGCNDAYDCSNYFPKFAEYLLNKDYELLSLQELASNIESIFKSFAQNDQIFLRPNSGRKPFAGNLFSRSDVDSLLFRSLSVSSDSIVVVSRPQTISREWRFIVVDGEPIAASGYKENGAELLTGQVQSSAWDFATQMASLDFQPDRVWVLDTCQTPDGRMFVLESNGFSSSNWYCCDLKAIVRSVSRAAIAEFLR